MSPFLDGLMRLWTNPVPEGDAAAEAFRQLYADPVRVNGTDMTVAALVERARALQRSFSELKMTVLDEVHAPDRLVIVFVQSGRHVGPLPTPLGELAPTGKVVERQVIDVLTVAQGRITEVRVVSDDLGMLARLGVALARPGPATGGERTPVPSPLELLQERR